ncbi:MAG: PEGA domain-containing protein [Parcubacteria group bacterium]
MQSRTRSLLFALVIAFFVLVAPLLLLYARGYSFKPESRSVVRTGMILIDSNLPKLTVTIDSGEPKVENDPIVLRGLEAGRYHVRLEREGFVSWEADLTVEVEKVTRVDDVVMLYQKPDDQQPITNSVGSFAVSPNSRYIAYNVTEGREAGLWLHTNGNEENRQLVEPYQLDPAQVTDLRWSHNSRLLLIHDKAGQYYYLTPHVSDPKLISLELIKGVPLSEIELDRDEPTIVYYRDTQQRLYRWRTAREQSAPERLATSVLDFVAVSPKLFTLSSAKEELAVHSYDMREAEPNAVEIARLPGSSGELLAPSATQLAALADGTLYLLDQIDGEFTFRSLATEVQTSQWSPDGQLLWYQKGAELWVHDEEPVADDAPEYLVTRLSNTPDSIEWYPDGRHLSLNYIDDASLKLSLLHLSRTAAQIATVGTFNTTKPLQFTGGGSDVVYIPSDHQTGLRFATITEEPD